MVSPAYRRHIQKKRKRGHVPVPREGAFLDFANPRTPQHPPRRICHSSTSLESSYFWAPPSPGLHPKPFLLFYGVSSPADPFSPLLPEMSPASLHGVLISFFRVGTLKEMLSILAALATPPALVRVHPPLPTSQEDCSHCSHGAAA